MEYSLKIKDIQMSDSKPIHIYIIKKARGKLLCLLYITTTILLINIIEDI